MQNGTVINQQDQQNKPINTQPVEQKVTQPQANVNQQQNVKPVPADTYSYDQSAKYTSYNEKELREIPSNIKTIESDFLQKEREYLQKSLDYLERLTLTNNVNIEQEKQEIAKIEAELKNQEPSKKRAEEELAIAKRLVDEAEQKAGQAKNNLFENASKRNEAAGKLVFKELSGLKMKDKFAINDLFRFVYHVAYQQAGANYGWTAFKKQALGKDNGADFFARLKNANFTNPIDTALLTAALGSKATALPEIEGKKKEIASLRALYDYAETFSLAAESNKKIAEADIALATAKTDFDNKSKILAQVAGTYQAIEAKLVIIRKYQIALEQVNTVVTNTVHVVEKKIEETVQAPVEEKQKTEVKAQSPVKDASPKKDEVIVGDGTGQTSPKKEVRNAAGVEFTESPSVEKKEGGACEGCNIF